MQFYLLEYRYTSDNLGLDNDPVPTRTFCEWFSSERSAVVRRLELFNSGKLFGKKNDHTIVAVDIEQSRAGLLAFLRAECV